MITGNTIVKGHEDNPGRLEATLMSKETLSRRTLDRFRRSNPSNHICWDRSPDKDSFFNVIDTHNHFRPFGGPPVPFYTNFQWMKDAGIGEFLDYEGTSRNQNKIEQAKPGLFLP